MTPDEIDQQLDTMAAEAKAIGDDDALAGLINLSTDTWIRIASELPTDCLTAQRGIHYRDVRVWIRSTHDDGVLSRREARERGVVDFHSLAERRSS